MKVYLAGDIQQTKRFTKYAREVEKMGHEVVSTWFEDGYLVDLLSRCEERRNARNEAVMNFMRAMMERKHPPRQNFKRTLQRELDVELRSALQKYREEFEKADLVIAFCGGGSFEAGYAFAIGKPLVTVGPFYSPLCYTATPSYSADSWKDALVKLMTFQRRSMMSELAKDEEASDQD